MTTIYDMVIRGGLVADGEGGALYDADIAILDGRIAAIGIVDGGGEAEIDARGLLVTPGFVDVHTHYDGQLTWSERLDPSSGHGVTTVVTGNCGVGFAPCRPEDREGLIRLMEGVEDVPGVVMEAGLPWTWESFAEFLDATECLPHDIDHAVMLPHSPLRVHVMGQRALDLEPATAEDRARMRALAREAVEAGAIGFGTSRNVYHQTSAGDPIPSLTAAEAELREIALGMADAGGGVLQAVISSDDPTPAEYELLHRVARDSGLPLSYTLLQVDSKPGQFSAVLEAMARDNAAGQTIRGQVFNRPVGFIMGLEASFHPFCMHPYYLEHLADLPLGHRAAAMRTPEARARLLAAEGEIHHPFATVPRRFDQMYPLAEPVNYEPDPATSIAAQAIALGVSPDAVALDLLLEQDGRGKLFVASANYTDRNLDAALAMMRREDTVLGLGDGGAHYGMICDASYPTTLLTHWVRDRTRGERLGVGQAVQMLTSQPAALAGFTDRGRIAPGLKADLNLIDLDRLTLHAPQIVRDLPGGGRRLDQRASGYAATLVSGVVIRRDGVDTGARPGRLVRSAHAKVAA